MRIPLRVAIWASRSQLCRQNICDLAPYNGSTLAVIANFACCRCERRREFRNPNDTRAISTQMKSPATPVDEKTVARRIVHADRRFPRNGMDFQNGGNVNTTSNTDTAGLFDAVAPA
jgi:hypothetical protein